MARKPTRKSRKLPAPLAKLNPFVLAAVAVAAVFALGFAIGQFTGPTPREGKPVLAQAPAVPPPAVKPAAPVPVPVAPVTVAQLPPAGADTAAEPDGPPPAITEPEPGAPRVEDEPAAPAKPTAVAMLPPPVPPQLPAGTPLWKKNALPFKAPADRPAIAIVIDDMGIDRKRSTRAAALPGPLTLSWLPYARDLSAQAQAGRARGHELMLHLPMEPSVHADPGPDALLVSLDKGEVQRRLAAALASFDGYVGVNNHMGSRFTADRARMAPVLAELNRRGLLWLDSRTTANSAGPAIAQELHMPYVGRDVFLDDDPSPAAVRAQLAKTEQVAKKHGFAIAIGHPHDATIDALASWLPDVHKRGFALVPVSAVVKARFAGG